MVDLETARLHSALVRWLHERTTEGIFTTDRRLVVQSWNSWMARATGQPAADVLGRSLLEVRPEIVQRGLERYYHNALEGRSAMLAHRFHGHLLTLGSAGAEMPQTSSVAPLLADDVIIGTITVIEDVSDRVNSEAELRRQIAVAQEARAEAESALRAKDEFLATLSHELRTPLNAVLGWTNILRGSPRDAGLQDRALGVIERNATAQARLIDDMLDVARIASGKIRLDITVVDLIATTTAAIDAITPSASAKRIAIRTQFEPGAKLVQGDAARLQQVIWNVLSNAVKFTAADGTVDVAVAERDERVVVIISDSGKGISSDFLPYVFDRFRQANSSTTRAEGGLGLGLALVRQLVDLHGGDVSVTSSGLGRGSSFTIAFPSISVGHLPESPLTAPADPRLLAEKRILIVDDDADWCEALATGLRARGAEAECVGTGSDAIRRLTTTREPFAALILDIGLPQQDGFSLIQQIRRLSGDVALTPAIAVTAYGGSEHERRSLSCGFDAFRTKPIAVQEVAEAILAVTSTHRPLDLRVD
jgi:PAS domain S-box-containing protein